jgi:predicted RND superfamily exporter protein
VSQRNSKAAKFLRLVPDHPIVVIAAVLAVAVLALSRIVDLRTGAPRLQIDPSIDTLLPAGDENRVFLDRFKQTFAAGDTILVALADDDIFTAENLTRIQRISEAIHALPEVDRVASLALSVNIRSENGSLVVENFYDDVPESSAELEDLRARALADPIYSGNLISADGKVSVVLVTLLDISDLELQASGVGARIGAIVESEWSHAPIWITGTGHIKTQLNEVIVSDMTVIVPIACLLMAIVTFIAFRSIRAVVVVVLSIQIAVLITIGFVAFRYEMLNQVTSAIPSILFVIGFTYAIHILAGYYDALRENGAQGREKADIVFATLEKVFMPVIFTGLTTAAGFFSLATSPLEAIKQYGVGAGVGVAITMVVSLTFTPALLALLTFPKVVKARAGDERFYNSLMRLASFDIRNRILVLLVGVLVAVV